MITISDYREKLKEEICKIEFDRTLKIGRYMLGGTTLGSAISIGSSLYEATKLEDFLHDPIKDPSYVFLGMGIMALSGLVGILGFSINRHIRDKKLKSQDEIVPSIF